MSSRLLSADGLTAKAGVSADNLGMNRFAAVAVLVVTAAGCGAGEPSSVALAIVDGADAKVDGMSTIVLRATVTPSDAVVSFSSTAGALTTTATRAVGGIAEVALLAPFESEVPVGVGVDGTVTATVVGGDVTATAEQAVHFAFPTDGAASLTGAAAPDRLAAGSGSTMTVTLTGLRLTETTARLRSNRADVVVPDTVAFVVDGLRSTASFTVTAPETPGTVLVEVQAGEVVSSVPLVFIGEGEAAFDLTGDFVQVVHDVTVVSDFWLLNGDNQCAISRSIAVVHVTQEGDHIAFTTESCELNMPEVDILFVGPTRPEIDASFVQAANEQGGAAVSFTMPSLEANAAFAPPSSAFQPLVVGADLDNDEGELPRRSDDPRQRDHDHDGNPGVTVRAYGERFTVYRTRVADVSAVVESSNKVSGTMRSETESIVYDDDGGGPTMTPHDSPMMMLRLDGKYGSEDFRGRDANSQNLSCADVMAWAANVETVFPAPGAEACQ